MTRKPYVGVVGAGIATEAELDLATGVGRLIAEAGAVLVCGGLGGVMDAAAGGCEEAGGLSLGVLPGDDRLAASRHLTMAVATGMGEARNAVVARTADVLIAVGGEYGTLSEIAFALKMGKPVVGLSTWDLAREELGDPIVRAATPVEAVTKALNLI
ncbi:MAG: hypothetical protein QOI81_1742 [Actinomycetota bacterium]|nr:hypothetical protein [Actinomycetota bacterium]